MAQLKGISDSKTKQVVELAIAAGFTLEMGKKHGRLTWPASGVHVVFSLSPGDHRSVKNFAAQLKRVCGKDVLPKVKTSRSRKAPGTSGYSLEEARKENKDWDRAWSKRVERLKGERDHLIREFGRLGTWDDRERAVRRGGQILRRVQELEKGLENFHQPFEPFDPFRIQI